MTMTSRLCAFFACLLMAVIFFSSHAHADIYIWKDPKFGLTASFPDRWEVQSPQAGYERLRIVGDDETDATCVLSASEDRRFVIYPHRYYGEINNSEFNLDFWQGLLADKDSVKILGERPGGLGRGDARFIVADYLEKGVAKRALIFSSLYGDLHTVMHCSAKQQDYNTYAPLLRSIVSSVDFTPRHDALKTGLYRDFLFNR